MEQWAKSLEEPRCLVSSFAMALSKCWRESTRRQASTDSSSDAGVTNQSNDIFWRVGDRALTAVPHLSLREGSVPLLRPAPDPSPLSPPSWPFQTHIHTHATTTLSLRVANPNRPDFRSGPSDSFSTAWQQVERHQLWLRNAAACSTVIRRHSCGCATPAYQWPLKTESATERSQKGLLVRCLTCSVKLAWIQRDAAVSQKRPCSWLIRTLWLKIPLHGIHTQRHDPLICLYENFPLIPVDLLLKHHQPLDIVNEVCAF